MTHLEDIADAARLANIVMTPNPSRGTECGWTADGKGGATFNLTINFPGDVLMDGLEEAPDRLRQLVAIASATGAIGRQIEHLSLELREALVQTVQNLTAGPDEMRPDPEGAGDLDELLARAARVDAEAEEVLA